MADAPASVPQRENSERLAQEDEVKSVSMTGSEQEDYGGKRKEAFEQVHAAEEAAEQAERDAVTAEEIRLQIIDDTRIERDRRLTTETDPIITNPIRWDVLSAEKQAEWEAYRLALLAVPQQTGFPTSVTWPTKPE